MPLISDCGDKPELVAADVENHACANSIRVPKISARIGQILPLSLPRRAIPMQKWLLGSGVMLPELY